MDQYPAGSTGRPDTLEGIDMNGSNRIGVPHPGLHWAGALGVAAVVGLMLTGCAKSGTADPGAGSGVTTAATVTTSVGSASSTTSGPAISSSAIPTATHAATSSPESSAPTTSGDSTAMSTSVTSIEGVTWTLVAAMDKTGAAVPIPDGIAPTLEINGNQLAVHTGCNSGSGAVAVAPAALEVGPIATTRMACDDARMTLEQTVLGVLSTRSSYRIDDSTLTITNSAGTLVYQTDDAVGAATSVQTARPAPTAVTPLTPLTSVTLPSRKTMLPSIPEDPRGSTN